MKYLIGGKGNFYKANLHTHTTISDGKFTPEGIKKLYSENGYSIVAFTDHNVMIPHHYISDGKFLAITAVEINIGDGVQNHQFDKTYHLNFYAKDKNKTLCPIFNDREVGNSHKYVTDEMRARKYDAKYSVESVNEMIRLMREDGFLVTYNHPVWSLQDYSDYIGLEGLWGVEVFNSASDYLGLIETDAPYVDLLRKNANLIPIAADDTHRQEHLFGGFSVIEAKSLEYGEIISAMERGDLYSSTGPLIKELSIENGILSVKCDPVRRVYLNTERRWSKMLQGESITTAQFDLNGFLECNAELKPKNSYIRITVEDKKGYKAWTRAYGYKELY